MAETQERDAYRPLIPWVYDLLLWMLSILVDLFFREVHPRGTWRIPRKGPVIFVAAPHANQFVDSLILMRVLRLEAHRRISGIIAAHSMKRKFVGLMAGAMGSIPVGRAQDLAKAGTGRIYLPDPVDDPTLLRGVDTKFDEEAQAGGLLMLPRVGSVSGSSQIAEVISAEEIRLKKPFEGDVPLSQLTGREQPQKGDGGPPKDFSGTNYKVAPKVDQSRVYASVFKRLRDGGAVCIFPEGGSHDRTELLPLKAGVAIMALGSLAENPDSGLKIVPCGMNYFHPNKFRSRAVVEFGSPFEVPKELVDLYRSGDRREATRLLLEQIYQALIAVTVQAPDYETLMLIQSARRLYQAKGKKLPLPMVIELNRRMIKGYTTYKDDPRIQQLKKGINDYNRQLWRLGVRDYQVEYAKFSIAKVVFTMTYRVGKLLALTIGTLPGLVLFAPVFVTTKIISVKKSREALAASTVKLAGRDVVATWKLLVAMAFAPTLYTFYVVILVAWTHRNRVQGYVPEWVPLWLVALAGYMLSIMLTFAALRIGEVGMDILKSLRPLALSLNPSSANTFYKLRIRREELAAQLTELINELGPELFDDFDSKRVVPDPVKEGLIEDPRDVAMPATPGFGADSEPAIDDGESEVFSTLTRQSTGAGSNAHEALPRNESFGNLGNLSFFSTRPPSRSRSRPRNVSDGLTLTSKEDLESVSKKIRGAMQERGKARERRRSESSWSLASSGAVTPNSEGKKDL